MCKSMVEMCGAMIFCNCNNIRTNFDRAMAWQGYRCEGDRKRQKERDRQTPRLYFFSAA